MRSRAVLALVSLLLAGPAFAANHVEKDTAETWFLIVNDTYGWVRAWGSAFPGGTYTAPAVGDRFERIDQKKTYTWNGSAWISNQDWTQAVGAGIPAGSILITLSSCPSGFTESSTLNGQFLRGTIASNSDVGNTGGTDSVTPTGSNSAPSFTGSQGTVNAQTISWPVGVPTFAGSALGTHTHGVGTYVNSTVSFTPAGTNGTSATTGNCAATNIAAGTGSTTACKATAPNLSVTAQTFTGSSGTIPAETISGSSAAVSAGTPAGTIAWPAGVPTNGTVNFTPQGTVAAPTFTGNSFDNRPAYTKVIFCVKS